MRKKVFRPRIKETGTLAKKFLQMQRSCVADLRITAHAPAQEPSAPSITNRGGSTNAPDVRLFAINHFDKFARQQFPFDQ